MSMLSFGFRHGVHPPERKELTAQLPIRRLPFPTEVVLPVRQHAGKSARVVVRRGDRVERGDVVAVADGFVSSPVHASAAGRVSAIEEWPHPDGTTSLSVRIEVDRYSAQVARPRTVPDWHGLSAKQIVQAVQDAGLVGLGGAAFPTHVKLAPPEGSHVEVLLVNGAECEPYLTTDHRSMVEYPERVQLGIRIMLQALGITRAVIGVERNKPDAIERLQATLPRDLDVTVLPLTVKYPQGAEKMLVHSVLGKEVPSGQLPISVGAIVQNVGSVTMIGEVFDTGLPLVERIVTATGHGLNKPGNLIVPVGTKLRDLLEFCGGLSNDAAEILFGGPMMGLPVADLDTPILKGTTGVVVLTRSQVRSAASYPCIHCGYCLDACPVFLDPQYLGSLARVGRYDDMSTHHLADCMLCGSCSYVCPSNIPLSQLFQASKAALRRAKAGAA
jgi:electron transport complex protein RnfC